MEFRREFKRLEFQAPAFMSTENRKVFGEVCNLSNKGMYVQTQSNIFDISDLLVTVYFNGTGSSASITVPAKVVRRDDNGVGIYSPEITVASYLELKNMLSCFGGNDSKLLSEFYRFADSSSKSSLHGIASSKTH